MGAWLGLSDTVGQSLLDAASSQPDPHWITSYTKPLVFRVRTQGNVGTVGHLCLRRQSRGCLGVPSSLTSGVIFPSPHQSRTLQALGKPFPKTPSVILWGSASGLVFVDGLSLSQIVHSREMTAGVHVVKEPGCFS